MNTKQVSINIMSIAIIAVVVIVIVGYTTPQEPQKPERESVTKKTEETRAESLSDDQVLDNWKTYRNESYGFEFKYPKDVTVYTTPEPYQTQDVNVTGEETFKYRLTQATSLSSSIFVTLDPSYVVSKGKGLDISTFSVRSRAIANRAEYDDIVENWINAGLDIEQFIFQDKEAMRIIRERDGVKFSYILINDRDKNIISITGEHSDKTLRRVFKSFKFIEEPDPLTDLQTYESKNFNLSLKYPFKRYELAVLYNISDSIGTLLPGEQIKIVNVYPVPQPVEFGSSLIISTYHKKPQTQTAEEYINITYDTNLISYEKVAINNTKWLRVRTLDPYFENENNAIFVTEKNEFIYIVNYSNIFDPLTTPVFKNIIQSIEFLDEWHTYENIGDGWNIKVQSTYDVAAYDIEGGRKLNRPFVDKYNKFTIDSPDLVSIYKREAAGIKRRIDYTAFFIISINKLSRKSENVSMLEYISSLAEEAPACHLLESICLSKASKPIEVVEISDKDIVKSKIPVFEGCPTDGYWVEKNKSQYIRITVSKCFERMNLTSENKLQFEDEINSILSTFKFIN